MMVALFEVCALLAMAGEPGLVAYYRFDEGDGAVAKDAAGRGNDGTIHGATFVKHGDGYALQLDGEDDYVEIAPGNDFAGQNEGAFELWLRPRRWQGGLVDWSCGGSWQDIRLSLAFNTYNKEEKDAIFLVNLADGKKSRHGQLPRPPKQTWTHVAVSFRGGQATVYRDGRVQAVFWGYPPERQGLPLWIGRCQGLGRDFFAGQIDEVRVYNKTLTHDAVLAHYKSTSADMGKETADFDRPKVETAAMPDPGWIVVAADFELMRPLPSGAVMMVGIGRSGTDRVLVSGEAPVDPARNRQDVKLDASRLGTGQYDVVARITGADGQGIGKEREATVTWPGRSKAFQGVKVLNNLVWELASISPGKVAGSRRLNFQNPLRRWACVSCNTRLRQDGRLCISIPSIPTGKDLIVVTGPAGGLFEAMRPLPAGRHELEIALAGGGTIERLVIRSIPELIYARYGSNPHTTEFGPYSHAGEKPNYGTAFIDKYVLPNVNTLVFSSGQAENTFLKHWHARGGRSLFHCSVPKYRVKTEDGWKTATRRPEEQEHELITADEAYDYIRNTAGFSHPGLSGSIADEFGNSDKYCAAYSEAIRKLAAAPEYKDRVFYPYANHLYTGPEGVEMTEAIVAARSTIAWKRYLKTQASEQAARHFLQQELVDRAWAYRQAVPESLEHIAVCFGYFSAPNEFLNSNPSVNYKKYLDMQVNIVANDPAFWATYGLMSYLASYADEESIRWLHHLFRYYGIEGNTAPRCIDPHDLTHMENSDFVDRTSGWTIEPAEEGSVSTARQEGLGWLQGRYPRTSEGDTGLLMVRSDRGPNVFRQGIKDLEPGRLYSFRMFCSDFDDMSKKGLHAVTVTLDNVELIEDKCFNHVGHNCYSHAHGPYNTSHWAWFNYIWRVFRAKAPTAAVTVTDWKSPSEPGGRIGQKLIFNFAHVQPYYAAEGRIKDGIGSRRRNMGQP
jgi:hypothetical protein